MKPKSLRRALWVAIFSLPLLAPAQVAVSSASGPDAAPVRTPAVGETVVLGTFTVNADNDVGYQAVDTIVGGRLKTNLMQTPTDVSVLTREFLDDLAITDLATAGNWLTGSEQTFPNDVANATDFGQMTKFRGLGTGVDTRNGFRADATMEAYGAERMEGARGSNAILFGTAPAGGQVNFTTKMARFRNVTTLTLRTDQFGTLATYLDFNRRISDKLAVRANAQLQRKKTWLDRGYDNRYGFAPAVTYRPWSGGEIRFDGQFDYARRSVQMRIGDQTSKWDGGTTLSAPLTANPAAATGLGRFTNDKMIWIPALGHTYNFRNFAQTTGSGVLLVDDPRRPDNFPILSRREFILAPPEDRLAVHTRTAALFFEQALAEGLTFEIAGSTSAVLRSNEQFNLNNVRRDVNRVLPALPTDPANAALQANPNFGQLYSESTYVFGSNDQVSNSTRAALAYDLKRFQWFHQLFGVSGSTLTNWFYPNTSQTGRTNGANPDRRNAANQLVTWRYWDHPTLRENWPTGTSDTYTIERYYTRDDSSWNVNQTLQFSTVGYFFGDKLSLIAGWRRDRFKSGGRVIGTYDTQGNIATYDYVTKEKAPTFSNSQSLGLTYFPLKQVGIYANKGGGLQQGGSSSSFLPGRTVFFSHSKTWSGGLRFALAGGRIIGRIGAYDSKDQDRAVGVTKTNINAIWNAMGHPEKIIFSEFSTYADTLDYHGWGREAEVTLNVSKRVRLTANVSLPKARQVNARPGTVEYINRNRAEWENAAKGLDLAGKPLTGTAVISPASQVSIANNLPAVYDLITAAADQRNIDGVFKYRANVFGVAELPETWIKGVSVGGGANFYGKRQIGNQPDLAYDYVFNEASYTATAFASYRRKIGRTPTSFQINAENLFDWNRPVFSNTVVYQAATTAPKIAYRNAYNYYVPRNFTLTVKFDL